MTEQCYFAAVKPYLLVGLGNPGPEYATTRHNIGFRVLDTLANTHFPEGTWKAGRHAEVLETRYRGRPLRLIKPTTYMNLSGKAVGYHAQDFLAGALDQLLVITDELALPFGTLRIRGKGSAGGHNGLQNIEETLRTGSYPRMRCGIGADFPKGTQVDYVLAPFSDTEETILPSILKAGAQAALSFVFHGLAATMTSFNRSWLPEPPTGTS